MLGEIDTLDFFLAEALGKTLAEVRAMPSRDFAEWRAFYQWRNAMQEMEAQRARH